MTTGKSSRSSDSGFSLIEVMVSLLIFALIGTAGFSVLDQILRTQRQTEGRLERLAEIQRALQLITLDFTQAENRSLAYENDIVNLRRSSPADVRGFIGISYALVGGVLVRSLSQGLAEDPVRQPLLSDVGTVAWKFFSSDAAWSDQWPVPADPAGQNAVIGAAAALGDDGNPKAVSITLTLAGPGLSGSLERVTLLPEQVR